MKKSNDGFNNSRTGITEERIKAFDEESTAVLAQRLEIDDYESPFDGLSDWHMLRALAIHRPELTLSYLHLIDQEPFDED
tara:strand:+ start:1524 stop:1763 length:240 start_codon:yes stop_codon:yes gene_type:complete